MLTEDFLDAVDVVYEKLVKAALRPTVIQLGFNQREAMVAWAAMVARAKPLDVSSDIRADLAAGRARLYGMAVRSVPIDDWLQIEWEP